MQSIELKVLVRNYLPQNSDVGNNFFNQNVLLKGEQNKVRVSTVTDKYQSFLLVKLKVVVHFSLIIWVIASTITVLVCRSVFGFQLQHAIIMDTKDQVLNNNCIRYTVE